MSGGAIISGSSGNAITDIVNGSTNSLTVGIINSSGIQVDLTGTVSTGNSTTTPLGISGVFTGVWEEVINYSYLSFTIFTNQNSITDGLSLQWSSDGTNIDRIDASSVLASTGRALALSIKARYFRVVYTNDGVAEATLRIQTVYHRFGSGITTKPLDDTVTTENFAELTQSPIMGKLPDNSFSNISGLLLSNSSLLGIGGPCPILADQGNLFRIASEVSTGSTTEIPYILIINPNASGKTIRLSKALFGIPTAVNNAITYRIYIDPTVTANGSSITPVGARQVGQVSPVGTVFSLPTVSSNGTKFFTARTDNAGSSDVYDFEFGKILDQNHKLLITVQQGANAASGLISLLYSET